MAEDHIDTGFGALAATLSSEAAVSSPEHDIATSAETAPAVAPHPQGPSVAEQLAAQAPAQTDAEKAFAEPIKILAPEEHIAAHVFVGNDPGQVAAEAVESDAARKNRAIYERILAARNQPPAVPVPQPVARRITDQTRVEMAEGARMSAIHAERTRTIKRPQPSSREIAAQGSTTPVFRPADFVPDPVKNQGNVRSQPVI